MRIWRLCLQYCVLATSAVLLSGSGCIVTVDPIDGIGDGDPNSPGSGPETIALRIVNATTTTLDPQIFLSADPVGVDELFVPANQFTEFGVGTLGLLGPGGTDVVTIDCAAARVIGTDGGAFGDDLNQPEGFGRRIVLTQDLNVFCGGSVTFRYSRTAGGFTTTFDVEP
jgi:hypothetical protein